MAAYKNDENSIGRKIGNLMRQISTRIAYAKYKACLYEEEMNKASATNRKVKEAQAKVAKASWEVYCKNLIDLKADFEKEIQTALIGYSGKQKEVWRLYFIENKNHEEIAAIVPNLSDRTCQRMISAMKADMSFKLNAVIPSIEKASPNWTAKDLAEFLTEEPQDGYVNAIKDLLEYGAIDLDALEFDESFQEYLRGRGR